MCARLVCGVDGPRVRLEHLSDDALAVVEPLRRPDSMEGPAEALQLFLAKAVAVARARSRVIGRAVALDGQDEPAGLEGMADSKVDPVSRRAVLRDEAEASGRE